MTDSRQQTMQLLLSEFAAGRYAAAEPLARELAAGDPLDPFGWKALGAVLSSRGRPDEALESMERALALAPGDAETRLNLGNILKELGRPEAEASFRCAVALEPGWAVAHFNLANLLGDRGRLAEARESYLRALELDPAYIEALSNLGNLLGESGCPEEAEACYRRALAIRPLYAEASANLGNLLKVGGRLEEALDCYLAALALRPDLAGVLNNLGIVLRGLGRTEEAAACYVRAVTIEPGLIEAHFNLAIALGELDRLPEAEGSYRRALELRPDYVEARTNLGNLLKDQGRLAEAEACYRRVLELDPGRFEAWANFAATLNDLGRTSEALAGYRRARELSADSLTVLLRLGCLLDRVGADDEALDCLTRAIVLAPESADAHSALGNLLLRTGRVADSRAMFRRSRELSPVTTWHSRKKPADFSVLVLDSPGPGSTPVNYLLGTSPFDCHFYCVLPDEPQDFELLAERADVVINLIADADNGAEILPVLWEITERLGRPTLNRPQLVMGTDRESMARRLAGLPSCRIPGTRRLSGRQLLEAAGDGHLHGFFLPVLVRLAGNHGGDDFEKLADLSAVAAFVARRSEESYYLTEFADYRSADGFYRKYRLICIDGVLFPYHLAIHDDWKVHHFRTDMENQAWMRAEEEAFLREPGGVFDGERLAALGQVAAATGLDYCGIDCGIDREGRVVVFEANASMLVHEERDGLFAYKNRYVASIKDAFRALLARLATGVDAGRTEETRRG